MSIPDFSQKAKCAEDPQVEIVRDMETGELIDVAEWIPTQNVGDLYQLSKHLRSKNNPKSLVCYCCGYPVLLRKSIKEGHFFAHIHKEASEKAKCPYQQNSVESQRSRSAAKWQSQRESVQHIEMKRMIEQMLLLDANFSDVRVEKVWKTFNEGWRKPDVAATYKWLPVVFEVQLSNTFPLLVAQRTDFYMSQGALLIWVYPNTVLNNWVTMHSHDFCTNQHNLFVVDNECVDAAIATNQAHFRIYTQRYAIKPCSDMQNGFIKYKEPVSEMINEIVPFSSVRLDQENQTAVYFYDQSDIHTVVANNQPIYFESTEKANDWLIVRNARIDEIISHREDDLRRENQRIAELKRIEEQKLAELRRIENQRIAELRRIEEQVRNEYAQWRDEHKRICKSLLFLPNEKLKQSILQILNNLHDVNDMDGYPIAINAIEKIDLSDNLCYQQEAIDRINTAYETASKFVTHLMIVLNGLNLLDGVGNQLILERLELFKRGLYKTYYKEIIPLPQQHIQSIELLRYLYPRLNAKPPFNNQPASAGF